MNILLLEDDYLLAEIIGEHLIEQGHTLSVSATSEGADEAFAQKAYDLLILDVNVPGMNGFEFLKMLRTEGYKGAAIFITALQGVEDLKKGFSSGADDYIRKPFDLDELDIRIANVMRLKHRESKLVLNETTVLDVAANILYVEDKPHELRNKECKVLAHLIRQRGRVVSQEDLVNAIWGYDERPDDSTLRSYIKNLRKLIGAETIKTIRNAGYRID